MDSSNTDTSWPFLQALILEGGGGGDSPLLFSGPTTSRDQKINVAELITVPNTNSNENFISGPNDNNINNNNNDKPLLLLSEAEAEATTSETSSSLLASNTNCKSSSSIDDDSAMLEYSQQQQIAAGQQSPIEKRNIRGRRRRRRRFGETSGVSAPTDACPTPPLLLSPPSTAQPQKAQNPPRPQKGKKKKTTSDPPQSDGNTEGKISPPPSSSADLDWSQDMYPSLFRIPTDGYTEGGYNPTCIMKTNGLLPLGVCDSGEAEDVQGSKRDLYGNQINTGFFLDAVAFKLDRCELGMCESVKETNPPPTSAQIN